MIESAMPIYPRLSGQPPETPHRIAQKLKMLFLPKGYLGKLVESSALTRGS